jgi:hypothetical protein
LELFATLFQDTSFVAFDGDNLVGYALCATDGRSALCPLIEVVPPHEQTLVFSDLLTSLAFALLGRVDECLVTVPTDEPTLAAFAATLEGPPVVWREDFFGTGEARALWRVDRAGLRRLVRRNRASTP